MTLFDCKIKQSSLTGNYSVFVGEEIIGYIVSETKQFKAYIVNSYPDIESQKLTDDEFEYLRMRSM